MLMLLLLLLLMMMLITTARTPANKQPATQPALRKGVALSGVGMIVGRGVGDGVVGAGVGKPGGGAVAQ